MNDIYKTVYGSLLSTKPEDIFDDVELMVVVAEPLSPGQKMWHFKKKRILELFEDDKGVLGKILRKVYNRRVRLANTRHTERDS
jgi:hypothetical protein